MSATTAADLNARHIGQPVSITFEGWEHNGILDKVQHERPRLCATWVGIEQVDGSRWFKRVPSDTPVTFTGPREVTR